MQQYVIFNVLKEYCIPKEEEEDLSQVTVKLDHLMLHRVHLA